MAVYVKDKSLLSCWPDGFSRYYSIARILLSVFGKNQARILDVGGNSKWMYLFLKDSGMDFKLQIVDTRQPDFTNKDVLYTKADFFKLNSEKYRADAVINTDVLEHISDNLKIPFIKRCIELSDSIAVFSAPHDDEQVTLFEETINSFTQRATGKQQRWLKEHFIYGKPDSRSVIKAIENEGLPFLVFDTNNLDNWLLSFAANLINQNVSIIKNMDELNRLYNSHIDTFGDFSGKAYRKIFIVFKNKKTYEKVLPKLEKEFLDNTSDKAIFENEIIKALVNKILDLKEANDENISHMEQLKSQLSNRDAQIKNLDNQLDKIFSKFWFRYLNKADSILRREE
jgi:hypothetical protein